MTYDLLVTAVSDRHDLFAEAMESILRNITDEELPARFLVHEDVRPGHGKPGQIKQWLEESGVEYLHEVADPPRGMGLAMQWLFEHADGDLALYTQEDWLIRRPLPVGRALALMEKHSLNHILWNKRKTLKFKHEDRPGDEWEKIEVEFDGQKLCVCDHWRTQTSLWRVSVALEGIRAVVTESCSQAHLFVGRYNDWMNSEHGDGRKWNNQQMRHERIKTYIWGAVGEPAFVSHLGSSRGTGKIKNHFDAG